MAFLYRLGYFLGGFSIGLVLLFFILNGKKTRCHYGPQARVIDNISQKEWISTSTQLNQPLDSLWVASILKGATIDFKKSNTQLDSCKKYHLTTYYQKETVSLVVENCRKKVIVKSLVKE